MQGRSSHFTAWVLVVSLMFGGAFGPAYATGESADFLGTRLDPAVRQALETSPFARRTIEGSTYFQEWFRSYPPAGQVEFVKMIQDRCILGLEPGNQQVLDKIAICAGLVIAVAVTAAVRHPAVLMASLIGVPVLTLAALDYYREYKEKTYSKRWDQLAKKHGLDGALRIEGGRRVPLYAPESPERRPLGATGPAEQPLASSDAPSFLGIERAGRPTLSQ